MRNKKIKCDILIFEGSITLFFKRAGMAVDKLIARFDGRTKTIITVGTCASFGGIFSQNDNQPSGILYQQEQALKKPLVSKKPCYQSSQMPHSSPKSCNRAASS
ncbi:NADH-quinone oxidoreductase subunit B family protein [Hydrogenimonas sp.]